MFWTRISWISFWMGTWYDPISWEESESWKAMTHRFLWNGLGGRLRTCSLWHRFFPSSDTTPLAVIRFLCMLEYMGQTLLALRTYFFMPCESPSIVKRLAAGTLLTVNCWNHRNVLDRAQLVSVWFCLSAHLPDRVELLNFKVHSTTQGSASCRRPSPCLKWVILWDFTLELGHGGQPTT